MRLSLLSISLLLLLPALALAQSSGGPYVVRKQVIAGGAVVAAGSYRVVGTTAQPAASVSSAGNYRLTSGFHGPAVTAPVTNAVFANGFE